MAYSALWFIAHIRFWYAGFFSWFDRVFRALEEDRFQGDQHIKFPFLISWFERAFFAISIYWPNLPSLVIQRPSQLLLLLHIFYNHRRHHSRPPSLQHSMDKYAPISRASGDSLDATDEESATFLPARLQSSSRYPFLETLKRIHTLLLYSIIALLAVLLVGSQWKRSHCEDPSIGIWCMFPIIRNLWQQTVILNFPQRPRRMRWFTKPSSSGNTSTWTIEVLTRKPRPRSWTQCGKIFIIVGAPSLWEIEINIS